MKKTIFIYIYGYIPGENYGGPVSSIFNFCEIFAERYDIRIICSNHDFGTKERYKNIDDNWNYVGKANVKYLSETEYSCNEFMKIMKKYDIAMVYLTGIFSYRLNHSAIKASKYLQVPVVIATRGEICKNILAMKRYKKLPYLYLMRFLREFEHIRFQVTSSEEYLQLKKYLNIKDSMITMLPNIHYQKRTDKTIIKKCNTAKMLFISRIHPKKNLLDVMRAMSGIQGELQFDIYGPIEDHAYWEVCKKYAKSAPKNVKIEYHGKLNMIEAKEVFSNYHAFIFPTLSENYGHVIVESIIAGCPVIISRGTTPWDDINNEGGFTTDLHNIPQLTNYINKIIAMAPDEYISLINKLTAYKNRKLQIDEIIKGYEKLINQKGGA